MNCIRIGCGGNYRIEENEFGEIIRVCRLCSRSPEEPSMTIDQVDELKGYIIKRRGRKSGSVKHRLSQEVQ